MKSSYYRITKIFNTSVDNLYTMHIEGSGNFIFEGFLLAIGSTTEVYLSPIFREYLGTHYEEIPFEDINLISVSNNSVNSWIRTINTFVIRTSSESEKYTVGYMWNSNVASPPQTYTRVIDKNDKLYSLNFGRTALAYNNPEGLLINNNTEKGDETIYAKFWKDYFRDRFDENNKMLTCYVNLKLEDIQNDILRKFITINGTLWVVVKIYNL